MIVWALILVFHNPVVLATYPTERECMARMRPKVTYCVAAYQRVR
jgi:hypothetical protein